MSLLLNNPQKALTATIAAVVPVPAEGESENERSQRVAALLLAQTVSGAPVGKVVYQPARTVQDMIDICKEFENSHFRHKISRRQFAKSKSVSRSGFDRYWKMYNSGKFDNVLQAGKRKRIKEGKFKPVEDKIIEYIKTITPPGGGKPPFSWLVLSNRAIEYARELLPPEIAAGFKASPGWLCRILTRHGIIAESVKRTGGSGGDNTAEESDDNYNEYMTSSAVGSGLLPHDQQHLQNQVQFAAANQLMFMPTPLILPPLPRSSATEDGMDEKALEDKDSTAMTSVMV